jgi:hypothetical protein
MLLLLAATDNGLASWFFGIFHGEDELLDTLEIPEGVRPIGALGLGYPASLDDRPLRSPYSYGRREPDQLIHRDRW